MTHKLCLLVLLFLLTGCARPHTFTGLIFEEAETVRAPALEGRDLSGEPFALTDLEGQLVLIFFGYTSCPDVCPLTLADLASVLETLEADDPELADRVTVLFVSVDPERDSPERIQAYLDAFDPDFRGIMPAPDRFEEIKGGYGVFVARQPAEEENASDFLVDHTSGIYLVDPDGRWAGLFRYETPVEAMAADLRELLKE